MIGHCGLGAMAGAGGSQSRADRCTRHWCSDRGEHRHHARDGQGRQGRRDQQGCSQHEPDLDDLLAAATAEGDRHTVALEGVFRVVCPVVLRYCRTRLGAEGATTSVSAEDVAQEICVTPLTALHHHRRDGERFLAMAYGIAAARTADTHRLMACSPTVAIWQVPETPDPAAGPEAQALHQELISSRSAYRGCCGAPRGRWATRRRGGASRSLWWEPAGGTAPL